MNESELIKAYRECRAMRDRLRAELEDWGLLCKAFTELRGEMDAMIGYLKESYARSGDTLAFVRDVLEREGEGEWWKLGGAPPWADDDGEQ